MIVTCPNCGARYRVPDTAGATPMRCAACQQRWVPGEEADAAPLPLAGGAGGGNDPAAQPPAAVPTPGSARTESAPLPQAEGDDASPRPRTLITIAAIVIGLALSVAAAGLWVDDATRAQLAIVPGVGDVLARLDPAPPPLTVTLRGQVTELPNGSRLLEVTGTLSNPTAVARPVPSLSASLSGPGGVAVRWTIAPSAVSIPAHGSIPFTATVTGFPANATRLSVTPG